MTGIERLRRLAGAQDKKNAWTAMLANELTNIADQIERERACDEDTIENVHLIVGGVIDDMERHVLGHEGMEDSPVARWARELREALGGRDEEVTDVATIRKDAYDAYEWVREHGGLDAVRSEWSSRVPYDKHEQRRQRLLGHIAECETALGRRNQRIKELGRHINDLTRENAELRRRAMPEGIEWPRYEDREPVHIGDEVSVTVHDEDGDFERSMTADSISFDEHGIIVCDPRHVVRLLSGERVNRPAPKVLDADGAEIREGDVLYRKSDGHMVKVAKVYGKTFIDADDYVRPGDGYTHRAPVFAADVRPLHEGETVWHVKTGREYVVVEPSYGKTVVVRLAKYDDAEGEQYTPEQLTHERPDTWERIEEDAGCTATKYNERRGTIFTTKQQVARDLVRRARALAERGK